MKTNKKLFLLLLLGAMCMTVMAQRHTDKLDRGLVVIPTGSTVGNSATNLLTWRRLTSEYYDVKYNVYKKGSLVESNLDKTSYSVNGSPTDSFQVAAVVNGVEQGKCTAMTAWKQYVYNLVQRCPTGYLDIPLAAVYDRNGNDVTDHYEPNDAEMADLDGDGQLEIIVKRLNTVDAAGIYLESSREFVVLDAYDVNWQTGAAKLMWRIDCGPNMASLNSTEINIIAYDWDEDGKAEVVLRGADNMIVYGPDGKKQLYTIGTPNVNTRNKMSSHTDSQYAWTHTGAEYLVYMNGETGELYQQIPYPLPRLESDETSEKSAWGDDYGHRSTKHFLGAPFLDGRKASLFLARGIYTRHKMIAMNLDPKTHKWTERWRWNNNSSGSAWYGNGYHNFIIADVDEDGRDEIVYGSMVIDDNGKGLSTTGLGHGDAQHVGDFDPYRKGLEFLGCLEESPYWGSNYRNATTSQVYFKHTNPKGEGKSGDDGRCLIGNFSNTYPGCVGRSVGSSIISSVADKPIEGLMKYNEEGKDNSFIVWGDLNFRIYWDGDLCSEILNSPGTAREAKVEKPGKGRLFTSDGCNMNNDSKNNPCFQGDIIGDWREEIVVRCGKNLRVYTSGMWTDYSLPTLWNDHQYRQAMVWQMMAYNQPPHLSYFLGEMEGITVAPPTLTNDGRTEVANGETISTTTDHLLMCETNDMTVTVEDGAAPYILTANTPSWVQGTDVNGTSGTKVKTDGTIGATNLPPITTDTYTHTLTGGAFTGKMRLVKQGNGILELPDVEETYTGNTDVWAGTLRFNGTMTSSPVWLNRHTTLETNGGTFSGGITADYGSTIAVGSEGITVGKLTLNHGARLVITLNNNMTASQVNVSQLVLNSKSGDVWENYGPKYLKPVVEFRAQSGSVADGTYDLGTISNFDEDKAIIEGLDGISQYSFESSNGHLFLVVGTGEAITCPEATFDISGYHATDDGLLPIVSINPGTFSYGGSDATPAVEATFNGAPVDLLTLYSEDYEDEVDASKWTNSADAFLNLVNGDATYGKYIHHGMNGINKAANRSAYTLFGTDLSNVKKYNIELNVSLKSGNVVDRSGTDFVIMSKGAIIPTGVNAGYGYNANKCNAPGTNYLFRMTAADSQTFTINDSVNLDISAEWMHVVIMVDTDSRIANYYLTRGETTVATGNFSIPKGTSCEAYGLFILDGRGTSESKFDNIRIYRTDGYYYTFEEPGTLTVTTSYPGCQSATATYEVTEAIMPGDVNGDRVVNILDVAQTISHIVGQTPDGFREAAADIDCNGRVDKTDLDAIVRLIAWQ